MSTTTPTTTFTDTGLASFDAGLLMTRAHKAFHQLLATCLGHHGLTVPQWSLLGQLSRHESLRPQRAAGLLGVKASFITSLVTELQELGLIETTIYVDDERGKELALSVAGRAKVATVEPLLLDCLNGQFGGQNSEALKAFFGLGDYIATNVAHT